LYAVKEGFGVRPDPEGGQETTFELTGFLKVRLIGHIYATVEAVFASIAFCERATVIKRFDTISFERRAYVLSIKLVGIVAKVLWSNSGRTIHSKRASISSRLANSAAVRAPAFR
jgi:hypothetical protein